MGDGARFSLTELDTDQHLASFASEVREGLTATPKRIPCRFFYDDIGSELFEKICELPEYYLTRAEREILEARSREIAELFTEPIALVELGSGSSTKTRLLIDSLLGCHGALSYVPVDISAGILESTSRELLAEYDRLEIRAIAGEYHEGVHHMRGDSTRPKLVIWLGSTIGNLDRDEAERFIVDLAEDLYGGDRLLLGIDLRKERHILEAAYDDAAGITARFNHNLLERINRDLGGRFDPTTFQFRAVYDEQSGAVDSSLTSRCDQRVRIEALDVEIAFAAGESIRTR